MAATDYSKHKDRDPRQTVEAIRARLDAMGVETELVWTSHQFDEMWSNRVTIAGTSLGTNGKCALTFSRPDAGDYLDDPYCELLLSLMGEYGGQAIVVDGRLASHIRATHPEVRLVASYNRCILDHAQGFGGLREEDYYRDLLERYDEVVVRCEAAFEGGALEGMADVADRIQVIVNQKCVPNCPDGARHIAATARSIELEASEGRRVLARWTQPLREAMGTVYIRPERRLALADRGFTLFKLQGRIAPATSTFKNLLCNILKDGMQAASSDVLLPLVEATLRLDGAGTDSDAMMSIPSSLGGVAWRGSLLGGWESPWRQSVVREGRGGARSLTSRLLRRCASLTCSTTGRGISWAVARCWAARALPCATRTRSA